MIKTPDHSCGKSILFLFSTSLTWRVFHQRPLILPLFGFPWSPQLRNRSIIRELYQACARLAGNNSNNKKLVFSPIRQREVNSLLVLLVIAFFAVTDFFRSNVELTFSFFWSCVCHYMRFTTLRTRPVNSHCTCTCSSMPDLLAHYRL